MTMEPSLLSVIVFIVATRAAYTLICLVNNIYEARRIGLPYALTPIHELERWAYLTDPVLRWYYRDYLLQGNGWPRWARLMIKDWHYEDKGRAHREYGPLFVAVSPKGMVCYVADSHAASLIVTKRRAFVKPPDKMKMLEPFGPNIGSTDGDLWKIHSRIASPSFDEFTQKLVWTETQRHTSKVVSLWSENDTPGFENDIYSLTMDVMGTVSFGQQANRNNIHENPLLEGHKLSLLEALRGVVMNLPQILLIPKKLLRHSPWKSVYTSYVELDRYMNELLAQAMIDLSNDTERTRSQEHLLKAVVRSSQENEKRSRPDGKAGLTNEEIKGNLFIFLLAGYDTTANTIIYACIILALYPHIQKNILDEVKVFHNEKLDGDGRDRSSSEYLAMFPYLLGFMHEIMRVFPIIIPIARQTVSAQEVPTGREAPGSKRATLPGGMDVVVNNTAIHFSELNWPSPDIIDPRRWLVRDSQKFDPSKPPTKEQETDLQRRVFSTQGSGRGSFMTFSEGPRACLGRNFAKVEFVAFFSRLLQNHHLELGDGVNASEIERDLRLLSGGSPVTLIPPRSIDVRLVSRIAY